MHLCNTAEVFHTRTVISFYSVDSFRDFLKSFKTDISTYRMLDNEMIDRPSEILFAAFVLRHQSVNKPQPGR